jgi:hypothetical protein
VSVRVATTAAPTAPFWGDRYQPRETVYGKRKAWEIWDTRRDCRTAELAGTLAACRERCASLNADPAANFNGDGFPRPYFTGNVWDPEELCDCQDPPRLDGRIANVCGGVMGTFCRTHGAHDTCPRSQRGVHLATDPLTLASERRRLDDGARRLEDLAAFHARECDRVARLERLAARYSADAPAMARHDRGAA